jgi:hypothetical protein
MHKVDGIHEHRQGKEQAKETKAYRLLVVVLAKRASATCISSKAIFQLLSPVRFRRRPPFGATILSQRTPIRAG